MKKVVCLLLILVIILGLCACGNRQLIDTTYSYEYAYVQLPGARLLRVRFPRGKIGKIVIPFKLSLAVRPI